MTCCGSIALFFRHNKLVHERSIRIMDDIDLHDEKNQQVLITLYMIDYDICCCCCVM